MKEIITSITINASPTQIWKVLVDFSSYSQWNPFIKSAQGIAAPHNVLILSIQPPHAKAMTFKPTVLVCKENKGLIWKGKLFIPGLFDGEHHLELEPVNNTTTRFIQKEYFTGLLVPFLGNALNKTEQGFHEMNKALKARLEK